MNAEIGLDERSFYLRRLVVESLDKSGRGHLGPAMSLIEILRVLYDDFMRFNSEDPEWIDRDRLILSKGHGCLALYAMLADKGFIGKNELIDVCSMASRLGGHPEYSKIPGVEASTGALGHGLSIGVGMAIAARIKKRANRVIVIMGDGEVNEGSVWEAAMAASKHNLSNLIAVIDYNKYQSYGSTCEVLNMEPMTDKWSSFGFNVKEIDGHDIFALRDIFSNVNLDLNIPTAIICHTVKGKGIPIAENNPAWHHKSRLTEEERSALYMALER